MYIYIYIYIRQKVLYNICIHTYIHTYVMYMQYTMNNMWMCLLCMGAHSLLLSIVKTIWDLTNEDVNETWICTTRFSEYSVCCNVFVVNPLDLCKNRCLIRAESICYDRYAIHFSICYIFFIFFRYSIYFFYICFFFFCKIAAWYEHNR